MGVCSFLFICVATMGFAFLVRNSCCALFLLSGGRSFINFRKTFDFFNKKCYTYSCQTSKNSQSRDME